MCRDIFNVLSIYSNFSSSLNDPTSGRDGGQAKVFSDCVPINLVERGTVYQVQMFFHYLLFSIYHPYIYPYPSHYPFPISIPIPKLTWTDLADLQQSFFLNWLFVSRFSSTFLLDFFSWLFSMTFFQYFFFMTSFYDFLLRVSCTPATY